MAHDTGPGATTTDRPAGTGAQTFRALVTAGYFTPGWRAGGPIRSIAEMLASTADDIDVTLVTRDHDLGATTPYPGLSGRWVRHGRADVFYLDARRPGHWRPLWRRLRADRYDLLYVNSVWSTYSILPIVAVRLGLLRADRILVAPRGEFGAGALGLKSTKKRLFLAGWRRLLAGPRVLWHATTPAEAADIRRVLPRARIGVVAVGGRGPEPTPAPEGPPPAGPARLVFIGRISPMKNLDLVLSALAHVPGPVRLDIYGPEEDQAYWRRCRALVAALPASTSVTHRGVLLPDEVCATFARYDAFVLPTRGENFGHVIAESLSAHCPVICSDRTPWTEVLRDGGGWVVGELTPAALATEIARVAAASPARRRADRLAAGAAYRRWRDRQEQESVLDLARRVIHDPTPPLTAP
ncbi:glycosyltransferase [Micromonospora fluostatini]|uniref:glycosyltransferase n=1 Tax=Micromonospora sp. JCM 30529 TaxID=3421643 RepID=UPI003D185235